MYYILVISAIVVDQIVKYLVRTNMFVGQSIPVLQDIFHITYVQNTGAAFSILSGHTEFLALITAIITVGIFLYIWKNKKSAHWTLLTSLSLIIGGGIGNIIDRVFLRYVVDFFDFRIWPVFNIADICICCGCGLLVIYAFFLEGKTKEKAEAGKEAEKEMEKGKEFKI